MYRASDPVVMLFVNWVENNISIGVLHALLFSLVPWVQAITDREVLCSIFDKFMATNNLLGYVVLALQSSFYQMVP